MAWPSMYRRPRKPSPGPSKPRSSGVSLTHGGASGKLPVRPIPKETRQQLNRSLASALAHLRVNHLGRAKQQSAKLISQLRELGLADE